MAPKVEPTFNLISDGRISWIPEKDKLPFRIRRSNASEVSFCRRVIWDKLCWGRRLVHSSCPRDEPANSLSLWMILLYSRVFSAFSFIIFQAFHNSIFFFYFTLVCGKI